MFKAIKEFFVGKPKQVAVEEEPVKVETVHTETATTEPIKEAVMVVPDPVVVSVSDNNMNTSIGQPDTITLTPPVEPGSGTWPFPNTVPAESTIKKKRTFVKREETATEKKPTPAIKVNKNKPRKKK